MQFLALHLAETVSAEQEDIMAQLTTVPTSYASALEALKGKTSRKIGNNTELRQCGSDIRVTLHGNSIVIFSSDGWTQLRNAGWGSVTTRDRLNQFGQAFGLGFGQHKGEQVYFNHRATQWARIPFRGSLTISPDGQVAH